MLRVVRVFEVKTVWEGSKRKFTRDLLGLAVFHQFGVGHVESESGYGNYTTAIVEWPDGSLSSVDVGLIQFVNPLTPGGKMGYDTTCLKVGEVPNDN